MAANFVAPLECAERMGRVMKILEGNGEPGIVADVRVIRESLAEMRGASDERQKAIDRRHWTIMAFLGILTIAVMLMAVPGIARAFHVGDLRVPALFHQKSLSNPSGERILAREAPPRQIVLNRPSN